MNLQDNSSAFELLKDTFHKIDSGFHDPKGHRVMFNRNDESAINPDDIKVLVEHNLLEIHPKSNHLSSNEGVAFLTVTKKAIKYL